MCAHLHARVQVKRLCVCECAHACVRVCVYSVCECACMHKFMHGMYACTCTCTLCGGMFSLIIICSALSRNLRYL